MAVSLNSNCEWNFFFWEKNMLLSTTLIILSFVQRCPWLLLSNHLERFILSIKNWKPAEDFNLSKTIHHKKQMRNILCKLKKSQAANECSYAVPSQCHCSGLCLDGKLNQKQFSITRHIILKVKKLKLSSHYVLFTFSASAFWFYISTGIASW